VIPLKRKMKRLLLTSEGLTTDAIKRKFLELVGKDPEEITVVFIPTAAYPEVDKSHIKEKKKSLLELGIDKIQEVDLKGKNKAELSKVLDNADVIWVGGGNTFFLLYWMRKSGFDKLLPRILAGGKVYVGVSAGSIVAGPSIEVANWEGYDDPSVIELDSLEGLNLIDFHIFAHFGPKWERLVSDNKQSLEEELICLSDEQAVVVKGNKREVI